MTDPVKPDVNIHSATAPRHDSFSGNSRGLSSVSTLDSDFPEKTSKERESITHFDMCGCLLKRRGGFAKHMPNNYNLRFFTLKDTVLRYYQCGTLEEIQGREARGTINIRPNETSFTVGIPFDHAPTVFTMQLKNLAEEKWKLCAENEADLVRWTTAIHKALGLEDMPAVPLTLHRKFSHQASSSSNFSTSNRAIQPQSSPSDAPRLKPVDEVAIKIKKPTISSHSSLKSTTSRSLLNDPDNREIIMILVLMNGFFTVIRFSIISSSTLLFCIVLVAVNCLIFKSMMAISRRKPLQVSVPVISHVESTIAVASPDPVNSNTTSNASNNHDGFVLSNGSLVPIAGYTFKASTSPHSWSVGDATRFKVRVGPNYDKLKKKAPSLNSLYELVAMDFLSSDYRIDLMHSHVVLPDTDGIDTHHPHVPALFIVNCQVPTDTPYVFSQAVDDGPTLQAVFYFRIRQETCDALEDFQTASPAIKLFAKYCELAPMDPDFRARFKAIALIDNMAEFDLPAFVTSYNGKPGLIRKCSSISQAPNCLEIDINVHKFAYIAKQGLYVLMSYFHQMYLDLGFVIEARGEEEMPECIFGVARLNKIQKSEAINLFG